MSRVLTNEQNYYDIANTIRQMKNVNTTYKPRQMASALKDIYSNEVEGTLPLSFEANGNNLLNYRIDGASGGVGERTKNLFDKKNTEIIHAYFSPENLWQVNEDSSSIIIKVRPNTQYTLSIGTAISIFRIYKTSLENPEPGKSNVFTPIIRSSNIKTYTFTTDNDTTYIIFQGTNADTEMWINSLILNLGSTSLPYEPYGYKVPVVVNGKNLLNNVLTSRTLNGVTITVNQDKSINISGQLDVSYKDFYVSGQWNSDVPLFEEGTYKLIVESTNNNIPITCGFNGSYATGVTGTGNRVFTNQISSIMFRLTDSMTLNNETLKIMVCKPIIEDTSYEPYHETTTNIYLDEPILENESISLSDTNTNIPTIDGTNVITIDTTVQPSNVYIQAPKDSLEAIQIANRLEEI